MTTQLMLEELGLDYDVSWFNVHKAEEFPADFFSPESKCARTGTGHAGLAGGLRVIAIHQIENQTEI